MLLKPTSSPLLNVLESVNRLIITGSIIEVQTLRYTPAKLPVIGLRIAHDSQQIESSLPRKVEAEFSAVALGDLALTLNQFKVGEKIKAVGFLAARSAKSKQLVLHVTDIELLEGN